MKFTKMHGIGNDYIYINCFEEVIEDASDLAIKMSDRHFGVGSDGLVLILPRTAARRKCAAMPPDAWVNMYMITV